jgi:monoamine oxidase
MARTQLFQKFIHTFRLAQLENLKAEGNPNPTALRPPKHWSRRRFVKTAALAGGAAIATRVLSNPQIVWGSDTPRIAIIGAGLAGLNAAYQLKKVGLVATVYEARNRIGGRVQSVNQGVGPGLVADLGGSLINTEHADMIALAEEFGLRLFNRAEDAAQFSVPHTGYYFNGRIRPEAEVSDKLRPLAQQIAVDAARLDADFDRVAPELDRLSVTQYLDRYANKIPDPFIRVLVENTIRTEYGVEPENSSAIQLIINLPTVEGNETEIVGSSDEVFVVEGGSDRIVQGLAAALPGQIQTRMRLTQVRRRLRGGYRLLFSNNTSIEADYVILAIPFTVLRQLTLETPLPRKLRRFIQSVNLGFNEKLIAGFNQKVWRQNEGFVQEMWTDLGFSEVWDETQRQHDRPDGALTFFLGGDEVQAIQPNDTRTQGRKLVHQLNHAIPGLQVASNDQFIRTAWAQDPFTQGAYTNFKPGQLTQFGDFLYIESDDPKERQDVYVGNLVFAGEHLSDAFYGFMNGAAETGRLAAQVVIRQLQQAQAL